MKIAFFSYIIRRPIYIGFLVFLLIFALTIYLTHLRYLMAKDAEFDDVLTETITINNRLKAVISYNLTAAKTLAHIVKNYGVPKNFNHTAQEIINSNGNIDALQLTRKGVITNIYPLKGNEKAIGYNILEDPLRNKEAFKAIEKRELFFAGPLELRQGGLAVVGRLPIFVGNDFWGFSTVIVRLSTLLKTAGIDDKNNKYFYQLSKVNPNTNKVEFFLSSPIYVERKNTASIRVADGEWTLYVTPKENKYIANIVIFSIAGFGLSLICGLFAWYLAKQPEKLSQLVKERTSELIATQNNHKVTLERVSDAFIALDKNWRYTFINSAALAMYSLGLKESLGRVIWEVHPEMMETIFWVKCHEAMREGKVVELENYCPPLDKYFSVKVYPSSEGLTIFYVDVTERKKIEQRFAREKKLSESIVNSLPGVFYMYDREGNFKQWNKNFEVVSGYSYEEISQMHPLDFYDNEDKKLVIEKIDNVFKFGASEVEAHFLTKDKRKIPYYFNGHMATFDGVDYLIGAGIDITIRYKVLKDLRESEARLADAQYVAKVGSWETNLADLTVIWSMETYRIFDLDTYLNNITHSDFLKFVHAEDKEKVEAIFASSLNAKGIHRVEHRIVTDKGITKHIEERWRIIHDTLGNPISAIGTTQDITERKRAEEEIGKSHQELRQLSAHLQTIREEERTFIAREIHDELGQQLTVLKMDTSWLLKRVAKEEKEQHEKLMAMIGLIDDTVKSVRRISSDLRPGILDDLGLIAALEWQSTEFEKRTGIPCSFESSFNEVSMDKSLATGIFRIYQEALTNVMRHAQALSVETHMSTSEHYLILSIQDYGIGFDGIEVNAKKTLGLTGMKERALMFNGQLTIESIKGEGTLVVLQIPLLSSSIKI